MKRTGFFLIMLVMISFSCQQPKQEVPKRTKDYSHLQGSENDSIFDSISNTYIQIKKVNFGTDLSYRLDSTETEGVIDSAVIETYFILNDVSAAQIPLNRYIVSDNYDLYIGMILNMTTEELKEEYSSIDSCFIEAKTSNDVIRIFSQHDTIWTVKYLLDLNTDYIFSFSSKDSAFIHQMFTQYETPEDRIF